MLSEQTNTTTVGRLRIRSKAVDPQLEQQRISRMMRSATLHPAGLLDSALLVVRRLADPLPSRLRAGPFDMQPDPAWQRAVAAQLERLSATAARPAFAPVPISADAVLFCDRAEVLSSLAQDWLAGALNHWWWRELLRGRDAITTLLREWIEAPQHVPGALELLSVRSRAIPFVQRLPRQATAEMLEAVIRTFSVPRHPHAQIEFGAAVRPAPDRGGNSKAVSTQGSAMGDVSGGTGMYSANPEEPDEQTSTVRWPWMPWVPEASTPALSPVQKMLLVQALMLRRAPATARTAVFQHALMRWQARAERKASSDGMPVDWKRERFPAAVWPAAGNVPASILAAPAAPRQLVVEERSIADDSTREVPRPISVPPQAEPTASRPVTSADTGPIGASSQTPKGATSFHEQPHAQGPISPQELYVTQGNGPAEAPALPPLEPAVSVETEYGGIFFLFNVALYLSIYGDFSAPAEVGLELNIWDFLSLLATRLTGGEIESDPLWDALARLAGRTAVQRPGSTFDPPDEWRLSPEWLDAFPDDYDPQPVLRTGRMVTLHPAGFTLLDVPADATEQRQPVDRLQRWVGWMADYFRARLVRAMGREDAIPLLCRLHARVTFTLTHVDVTYSLNVHPIEIRMALLDRDPGWIPAAGRFLAFQFY